MENIREPKQERSILKKEKIIDAGWKLITTTGYYKTNTLEIAKAASVSTGIVYQYFKDKYEILIAGLEKYGDDIFFPILKTKKFSFDKKDFDSLIERMIAHYMNNHKVSNIAHEEIMAMVHSDKKVAEYYYKRELEMTNYIKELLIDNGFKDDNLSEKVHIMIGLIDNLCHEVTYHKHHNMDYDIMADLVIDDIKYLFKNDLN